MHVGTESKTSAVPQCRGKEHTPYGIYDTTFCTVAVYAFGTQPSACLLLAVQKRGGEGVEPLPFPWSPSSLPLFCLRERAARRRAQLQLLHSDSIRSWPLHPAPDPARTRTRETPTRGTHSVLPGFGRTQGHCGQQESCCLAQLLTFPVTRRISSRGSGPGDSSVTFRHQSITDCSAACAMSPFRRSLL